MEIKVGIDGLTTEMIINLWNSVGWVGETTKKYPERTYQALANSDTIYVAWEGDKPVGLCSALTDGLNTWISYLVVDSAYQNRGIGSELIELMLDRYQGHRVYVHTKNAAKFYARHGFLEDRHGLRNNQFTV